MERIKFRMPILHADGSFKEWFYWGFDKDGFTGPHSGYRNCPSKQFIGSRDNSGIDVFDGDYVKAPSGLILEVTWFEDEMRWTMKSLETGIFFNLNFHLLKVVGNNVEGVVLAQ